MKLDRNTLKLIRDTAYDLAAHSGMAPNWRQAYVELSNAADRLDAMLARNKALERQPSELPPTIPWDPDNAIIFVPEAAETAISVEDRVKEYFQEARKMRSHWFQVLDLEQEELYSRALKLANQISTNPCRISFQIVDEQQAKVYIKCSSKNALAALPIIVTPPALKTPEHVFYVRVVRLLLEDGSNSV